jgi:hypothetical protein
MKIREPEASWLGAEAIPGDLAEINRLSLATKAAAAQRRGPRQAPRRPGLIASAVRWLKTPHSPRW